MMTYAECLKSLNDAKELEAATLHLAKVHGDLLRLQIDTGKLAERIGASAVSDSLRQNLTQHAHSHAERFVASRRDEAASAYYRENVEEPTRPISVGVRVKYVGSFDNFTGTVVHVVETEAHVRRDDGTTGSGRAGAWRCGVHYINLIGAYE